MRSPSQKKTVLVTGAGGFLGSRVVARLAESGHRVVAASSKLNDTLADLLVEHRDRVEHLSLDLRQEVEMPIEQRLDCAVHLASYVPSSASSSFVEDQDAVRDGVLGSTVRLLQVVRGKIGHLVFASSTTVYGGCSGVFSEDSACNPSSQYAKFKLECEDMCREFCESKGISLAVLRLTQLYGPGEPHGIFLQSTFLPQAEKGGSITLVRGGRDIRDLLWIDDAVEAVLKVVESRAEGVFNVSFGKGVSVRSIAENLRELTGGELSIELADDGAPAISQVFDCSKARSAFGFDPSVDIHEGLRRLRRI